jgi:type II secretion system protein N
VKGVLNGTITYGGEYNLLIAGTGEAELRISGGQIELLEPILGGEPIDFDELRIKMVLKNRRIDLTDVELKGRVIQGTLSGSIRLKTEFLKSNLNLRGTLEPLAGFFESVEGSPYTNTLRFLRQRLKKGKLSFIIHGTLANPGFRFI